MINAKSLKCYLPQTMFVASVALLLALVCVKANCELKAAPSPVEPTGIAGLYDIDASGTAIRYVLEGLARCSGASIVVSPDVDGPITAHLRQMTVDSILNSLSTVHGFAWQKEKDTYLVASKERFAKPAPPQAAAILPEMEMCVWQCRNIKPAEVVVTIGSLFPTLKVVEGPSTSSPQLTNGVSSESSSGSSGSSGTGSLGGSSSSSGSSSGGKSRQIIMSGEVGDVARAKALLAQIDVGRAQVSIKVAITEITSSADRDLGINWSYSDLILSEGTPASSGIKFGKFVKSNMSFSGTISALLQKGNAKLLAEPNISVLDGEQADILIGDRILFPKVVGYSLAGTAIYDKAEERVGIGLQIAPRISDDGELILTVYPQVSLVTGYLKTKDGDYPQISTREVKTTVSLKDGSTLAIGGLIQDNEIKNGSKIPFLGNLPIIGGLFRNSKTTKDRTEIVIFITPTITKAL